MKQQTTGEVTRNQASKGKSDYLPISLNGVSVTLFMAQAHRENARYKQYFCFKTTLDLNLKYFLKFAVDCN